MRLDIFLVENGYFPTREKAKKYISDGRVKLDGKVITKPSKEVCDCAMIEVSRPDDTEYVSRGGYKLQAAIEHYRVDVSGLVACDLGASTGGFCDCLLRRGIKKVYAVDCGHGQLDDKISSDERVVSMENTNARYLEKSHFEDEIDIAVMDLSFISQTLVFPAVSRILKKGGMLISLIKPQFEVGRQGLSKNGIVKNEKNRLEAVRKVTENAKTFGLVPRDCITSPIRGGDGNVEYLCLFDYVC